MKVFNVKTGRGLPGKSFVHILDLSMYLRTALSYLVHTPFFDAYVASKIQRYYLYRDREKTTMAFINYMCVYDERRINYLMPSKFLPRSAVMELLVSISEQAHLYDQLMQKEQATTQDLTTILNMRLRYGTNIDIVFKNVKECAHKVTQVYSTIAEHYARYIVRQLLLHRRGDSEPDHLRTDAWFAISDMIDAYDPKRSKVPFYNILSYYTKNRKNKVINDENWGLPSGGIIHMGSLGDNEDEDITINTAQLQKEVESGMHEASVSSERIALLDVLSESLLKPFNTIIQLQFGIVEPFDIEEEVRMLTANKGD